MKVERKYRGWVVGGALALVVATANDVVGAVRGLYRWALVPQGQAVLMVALVLAVSYLALDKFAGKR